MKPIRKFQTRLTPGAGGKWVWTAVACLASGLVWALLCRLVEVQSIRKTLSALLSSEAALWLTGLFLGMLALALSLLLHSLFAGSLITGAAAMILTFINYYKMLITSTPLTIGDFALAGQVGDIASLNRASLRLSRNSVLALAGAAVWLVLCLLLSRPLRLPWGRSAAGGLGAVLAFCLLFWVGADAAVFRPLGLGLDEAKSQISVNLAFGTPLGLWRSLLGQAIQTPAAGRSELPDLSGLLDPAEPAPGNGKNPNIILILSESFFDVTKLEGVSFPDDPLAEFHALQKEGVSGKFYTQSLGYGTCNIELEIMTGLNTGLTAGEELYAYAPETFSRVPALPKLLRRSGYRTSLLHMFNDDIYHRADLFQYLGFDEMFFSGGYAAFYPPAAEAEDYWDYMSTRVSGTFYSDDLMSDLLIALYEKRSAEQDGPLFLYGSSMEGHQPYPADKYSADELTVAPVSPLTGEAADALRTYSQSAANASDALGKLVDYFRTCDDPTVIVFYGDHRPGLGLAEGGTVYSKLGLVPDNVWYSTAGQFKEIYSTDYLIWSNDPSLLPGEPGSTWDTSSNYLGAELLELSGVEMPVYWQLIDSLSRTRTADMTHFTLDRAGNLSRPLAGDEREARQLDALRSIVSGVLTGTMDAN